ncbi:hypothetical protein N0V84_008943 [Fusarium piperis]|uniref:G domain-containing protein n=1 Tax=Fusarium piperis TaxID=1435070 RepID=A0A9W8W786_9HYPO|nr:hypothetical protein N0V84_008943 [Fusarium piperis]
MYSSPSRATLAAPAYFEPIKVGSYALEFVDGGIGTNNPVFQTQYCAQDLWQVSNETNFDEQMHCMVSIGAGVGQGYSAQVLDMLENSSSVLTDTEATATRLTVPAGIGNMDLADTSKLADISGRTFKYLKENCGEQLDQCAEVIRRKYRPEKSMRSRRSRIDLVAFKTARSESESGSGAQFIALCLTMLVLIMGIIFANSGLPLIDPSAPIVAVMGMAGVGKSTFIDTIGGRHVLTDAAPKAGQGLDSVSWYRASINGRDVYLIDTPGLNNSQISDLEVLKRISKELHSSYRNDRLLNGIIYLYDISPTQLGPTRVRELDYLKLFLGKEAFKNCALVTNKWDLDSPSAHGKQQTRQQHLKQHHWKDMVAGGSTVARHDGSLYSAKQITSSLMDKPKIVLHHQHERVNERKSFWRTRVGAKVRIDSTLSNGRSEPRPSLWDTVRDWI